MPFITAFARKPSARWDHHGFASEPCPAQALDHRLEVSETHKIQNGTAAEIKTREANITLQTYASTATATGYWLYILLACDYCDAGVGALHVVLHAPRIKLSLLCCLLDLMYTACCRRALGEVPAQVLEASSDLSLLVLLFSSAIFIVCVCLSLAIAGASLQ